MADDGFITATPPNGGQKRRVPVHYLDEPFNFKLPPSTRQVREPATPATARVTEPAKPETPKEASR
jgi:hypothetical protein